MLLSGMAESVNNERFVFRGAVAPSAKLSELKDGVYHCLLATIGRQQIFDRLYIEGGEIRHSSRHST